MQLLSYTHTYGQNGSCSRLQRSHTTRSPGRSPNFATRGAVPRQISANSVQLNLEPKASISINTRSSFTSHMQGNQTRLSVSTRATRGALVVQSSSNEPPAKDLLIVGPGVLGRRLALQWLERFPTAKVVGQTNTTTSHEELKALGISPRTKEAAGSDTFPYVVFCAPPSGSTDYVGEVGAAADLWDGTGGLVFTSSTGVYSNDTSFVYTEESPTVPRGESPRVDKLLDAEDVVTERGGCVVRLAGLYTATRGAHTFYNAKGSVDTRGDSVLNLIHYKDAASIALTLATSSLRHKTVLGCDNHPVSKADIMEITYASGRLEGACEFTATEGPIGRTMNNDASRELLGWQPEFASFKDFMEKYAEQEELVNA